jgi:outer membrane protein assembly factor BamA
MKKGRSDFRGSRGRSGSVWLICTCCFLFSCTATSFLGNDEAFYNGASVKLRPHEKVKNKKSIRTKLETLVEPDPNTKILGMRPGVWLYFVTGEPEKPKGLRSWIKRKLGEPPVLMKDVNPERVTNNLQGTLFNDGYFESQVNYSLHQKSKKGYVDYEVDLYPAFLVNKINYPEDSIFTPLVEEIKRESLLETGRQYRLEMMKAELGRIEMLLENFGYYYVDDRYFLFEADSTVGNRKVDLTLTVLPGIPDRVKRKYVLKSINVVNDFYLHNDSSAVPRKTTNVGEYQYSSTNGSFRPKIITNVINLRTGALYRQQDHNYTISHLMGLGTFKFVNIKYNESEDSVNALDAHIYLTPLRKKSIRLETQVVSKSNNFLGPGIGVTFTNRNFLGGAERFEINLSGSYEWQISNKQNTPINAVELLTEASLSVPRMLLPFKINTYSKKYLPQTKFKVGLDFQRRIGYFQMNSLNVGYGYLWRETTTKSHELFPVEVNYVKISRKTPAFQELLDNNPTLANSFQNQFIPAMRYSFTLNTQLKEQDAEVFERRIISESNFYFRGNVSFSGNLLHLIKNNTGSSGEEPPYDFLGQPYSQFILGDVDFRHYWQIDRRNRLVTRLAIGAGYAYGNSSTLPYIKQFASGGSSSIRAFPARSIGPGTYNVYEDPDYNEEYFIDQRGDIRLEGNAEFRYDIFKTIKGAVFLDAGNIWLWKDDGQRDGAVFMKETFLKELAVGTGLGIRLDFNFFILRFDLAFPLRKPYLPDGDRWVLDEIDFGSKTWRRDNLILNIAIGYPF